MSNVLPLDEWILAEFGNNLSAIKSIKPRWKRTHYRAVVNWLTKYEYKPDATNLEEVQGLLEAFHHLCEVEDWKRASVILNIEQLHEQLCNGGYYHEQLDMYNRIIGKFNLSSDGYFFICLGNVHNNLSNYSDGIKCFEQSLTIARKIGSHKLKELAIGNIGTAYKYLGNYHEAVKYHRQSLVISRKIGEREDEGTDLCNLGLDYAILGKHKWAIKCLKESLMIAEEIDSSSGQARALANFALVYRRLGDYSKALEYDLKGLTIVRKIGDRRGEAEHLTGLGINYTFLGNYDQAMKHHQQSLTIANEINAQDIQSSALGNIGGILAQLPQYHSDAIGCLQKASKINQRIGNNHSEAMFLYGLATIYHQLGNLDLAHELCDRALFIAPKLDIPLVKKCQELKERLLTEQT